MRRQLAAMVLAAAIGPAFVGLLPMAMAQEAAQPAAAAPAPAAPAAVPVKRVVLYTSGVGYFEHFGTLHGNASTVLSFKTDQINDVLKSLLLQDLDGGRVTSVSYPTLAPLDQTLKSFQVDLSNDPPLADILKQLRGAKVTVTLPTGPVQGEVLGVEQKPMPVGSPPGAGGNVGLLEKFRQGRAEALLPGSGLWTLNLVNDSGILPIDLQKVSGVKLDDPELAGEMAKALAAVAMSRDKDKKPVTISFAGQGDHRVRIGYVVATPIWKASYRISLGEPGAADAFQGQRGPMANVPADQRGQIQGWAIVDNQTDNDWEGVELSLVSGRPISFIEDLYQPLYVPRPTVTPDLYLGLVPQVYSVNDLTNAPDFSLNSTSNNTSQNPGNGPQAGGVTNNVFGSGRELEQKQSLDSAYGVQALASGAKVGEAFEYTVHDVTLARQKSSMIPILSGPMRTERLSIYNAGVLPNNPLLGARLTNTTGDYIMQGPVTILDHGIYAGDAQVMDIPPGATRLISYGVDQHMQVNGGDAKSTTQLLTAKIVKGVLQVSTEEVTDQTYSAKNLSDQNKLLLIERPRQTDWQLVLPKVAAEVTDSLYRFELPVPAGKSASLEVQEQHVYWQAVQILANDIDPLLIYMRSGAVPQPVKDALTKAIQFKQAADDTQQQLTQLAQQKSELTADQDRMRKNMEAVSPGTDYYKKLLQKMDDQETQFEKIQTQEKQLDQQRQDQQKQLEDYLSNLSVG
ncbi:MAG TPA: hypothetical protein VHY37_11935 [Tepidisphaeraceae bacterium]|jgi:hypothetical protein|nr:hypothetical protein [Tepidisphaeraceae bacterium]